MKATLEPKGKFLVDAAGKRIAVMLDLATDDRLREAKEKLDDIRAYDTAKPRVMAEIAKGDFLTLTDYRNARLAKREQSLEDMAMIKAVQAGEKSRLTSRKKIFQRLDCV